MQGDEQIMVYDQAELLEILKDNRYHSPEDSETDQDSGNQVINVYNLSWRSTEVQYFSILFRNFSLKAWLISIFLCFIFIVDRITPKIRSSCVYIANGSANTSPQL